MRNAPGAHEVHLWRAPLDISPRHTTRLAGTLSAAEMQRVSRVRLPRDRARRIAAQGWLRQLLASYLDADPAALVFEPGAHGKPYLAYPRAKWLRFNSSHSGAVVVFGVASGREIGVDVEQLRDDVDIDGVSRRYFPGESRVELAGLEPGERTRRFFALWTRHEAYLKATGSGLSRASNATTLSGWTVTAFEAGAGQAAAVAVEGAGVDVPAAAAVLCA